MKIKVEKGDRFNMLTVIKELPKKTLPSGQTNRAFLCRCDCGEEKEVRLVHLSRGRIRSCGCIRTGIKLKTPQEIYIRKIWRAIKYRVSPNYCERHLYYDKGIEMCEAWKLRFSEFLKWSLENGLKKGFQIDRIDGNRGYYPSNCRVVTPKQNCNNRHNTHYVEYDGEKRPFTEVLEEKGLMDHYAAIRGRILRGWSDQEAIDKAIRKGNYKRTK